MEYMNPLADLDEYEKRIVIALANRPLQNIYELEKDAEISRRAIYGRIGGKYQLKKRRSLTGEGYVEERRGERLQTGHDKRLFSLTFKGKIAAFAINDENKNTRNGLIEYMHQFGLESIDCFSGLLKLWLRYTSQLKPGEFDNRSSESLHEAMRVTFWMGLRHALWEIMGGASVGSLPEKPFLGLSPVSLDSLRGYGLTRDEIASLEKHLAINGILSTEGMMFDLVDKQLKLKHGFKPTHVDRCTLYAGCLIIQLKSRLKLESQRNRLEKVLSNPSGWTPFQRVSGDVGIQLISQIKGMCDIEETSCPYRDSRRMEDRIECSVVRERLLGQ